TDRFVLYVGTVEPRKNLRTLVQSFEKVAETDERLKLLVVGRQGWLTDDLYIQVKQSAKTRQMIFTDYTDDADLAELYSACTVFVYPSLYEGFGFPPLEAMSFGAPVIASRIPTISEVLGNSARLVEPNVKDLTVELRELLSDATAREHLAQ